MEKFSKGALFFTFNDVRSLRLVRVIAYGSLRFLSTGYETMGFTRDARGITYREWAPSAQQAFLFGDFNNWCAAKF